LRQKLGLKVERFEPFPQNGSEPVDVRLVVGTGLVFDQLAERPNHLVLAPADVV
jgi:hypothetical protein